MALLDKPHRQAAEELLADMEKQLLKDEVSEILYKRQLLRSDNKQMAEMNLKNAQVKISATKLLIQHLKDLLGE